MAAPCPGRLGTGWDQGRVLRMPLRYLLTGMRNVTACADGPASAVPAVGILLCLAALLTIIQVRVSRWDTV